MDTELRPVDALRAHLPAYAGDVVLRAMRAPGDLRLELTEFVSKWRAPGSWAKPEGALDAVNDMWLPALAALHGNDGVTEAASFQRVPHGALYADQNQLTSIRMLFCALMRGFGFPSGNGSAAAPLSLDDVFEVILERHATHGVLAALAPGVAAKGTSLFEGVMAEHGTARAAVVASRDPTTLLPAQWVQTPSASWQRFKRESEDYAENARRSRLNRLGLQGAATPATPLRADLGHALTSPGAAGPAMPPKPGASKAQEMLYLRARLAELDAAGTISPAVALAKAAAEAKAAAGANSLDKRKQPSAALTRLGAFNSDNTLYEMGKKRFDVVAWHADLNSWGIDPATVCDPWHFCYGEESGRARAECRHYDLHSAEGASFHKPIPKVKPSKYDVSKTPEEKAAAAERGKAYRLAGKRPGAGRGAGTSG